VTTKCMGCLNVMSFRGSGGPQEGLVATPADELLPPAFPAGPDAAAAAPLLPTPCGEAMGACGCLGISTKHSPANWGSAHAGTGLQSNLWGRGQHMGTKGHKWLMAHSTPSAQIAAENNAKLCQPQAKALITEHSP
jgi:hypothetical protein